MIFILVIDTIDDIVEVAVVEQFVVETLVAILMNFDGDY